MRDQFVTYEIALKLKELGFDEDCFAIWSGINEINFSIADTARLYSSKFRINDSQSSTCYINNFNLLSYRVAAPIWSQVIDWLREKYGYHIEVFPANFNMYNKLTWSYSVSKIEENYVVSGLEFPDIQYPNDIPTYESYYDTLQEAIKYLLNKLKNENVKKSKTKR